MSETFTGRLRILDANRAQAALSAGLARTSRLLHDTLMTIRCPGLVLHGGTPVGQRRGLVESFQSEGGPPFFVPTW
jgi:hypothetical protein